MLVFSLLLGALETNCYIVQEAGKCLVIDPAGEADVILSKLGELHGTVELIVATHAHLDHTGAAERLKEITGAPFTLHEADTIAWAKGGWHNLLGEARLPKPDFFLKEGDQISLGNTSLQILHTPGHTPGGICILGEGKLFSGDTLFKGSVGRTDVGGNLSQLIASLNRLMDLPEETIVYPGHGPSTTIGAEKRANPFILSYL